MEKLKFDQEESFLLSDGEYYIDTDIAIRRRTVHRNDDHNMITQRMSVSPSALSRQGSRTRNCCGTISVNSTAAGLMW